MLLVVAVDRNLVAPESIHQIVGARLEDIGPEQPRGAIEIVAVDVDQRAEVVAGLDQELQPGGAFDITFELAFRTGKGVVDPIVAAGVGPRRTPSRNDQFDTSRALGTDE